MMKNNLLFLAFLILVGFNSIQAQNEISPEVKVNTNTDNEEITIIPQGIFITTTVGVLSGSSQNRQSAPFSFQSVMLYQFDEHYAAGAGIGIDFLEESYLPLVTDFRYYFRGTRFSPFVFAQAGYNIPTDKDASMNIINSHYYMWPGIYPQPEDVKPQGGFLINPGFGIRHMFHSQFGIEMSFSYRYQQLNYKYNANTGVEVDYSRLNIRIGILFQ
ncbi:MAG: hypothetical protein V1783_04230 [Bacteroidota bacterium]